MIGIVGIPSGEQIDTDINQFQMINEAGILTYDSMYKCFTFKDKEYQKVLNILKYHSQDDLNSTIVNFLNNQNIFKYNVLNDGSVNVYQDVRLKLDSGKIPIKFNKVNGDFNVSNNQLETLLGCPNYITGDFIASNNNIQTLKYGPSIVKGDYDVRRCLLENLDGSPKSIGMDFIASYNNITNLKNGPLDVGGSYLVNNCHLNSLEGSPEVIIEDFSCRCNFLKTLVGGPFTVNGEYDLSINLIDYETFIKEKKLLTVRRYMF